MKTIKANGTFDVLVSDADFDFFSHFNWRVENGYVMKKFGKKRYLLHRVIMGAAVGQIVDHINHNRLDNRRENLRIVTDQINQLNRAGANKNGKSGLLGVSWDKRQKKWRAKILVNGKNVVLGYFNDKYKASEAYLNYKKVLMNKLTST